MSRLIAFAFVVLGVFLLPSNAAAVEVVPADVVKAFDQYALVEAKSLANSGVAEVSGVDGYGPIHQVHYFSSDFLHGKTTSRPLPDEMWAANFLKGDAPVGLVMFWRNGRAIEFARASGDLDEARGLASVEGVYVQTPEYAAQFDLRGDTLVALDHRGEALIGARELSLAEANRAISAVVKADEAAAVANPGAVGGGGVTRPASERASSLGLAAGAGFLVVLGIGVVVYRRRHRGMTAAR